MSLIVIVALSILGIPSLVYGMITKNHPAFIIGLMLVVAAYLFMRRRLKASVRDKG
jgi:uncharacterized membrane protein YfcA